MLWRSCWHPARRPCMILYRPLWEDLVKILPASSKFKRSLHDLALVIIRRSCGDPGQVLSNGSLHDLVQVLVRRSCGDLAETLLKRSLHLRSGRCSAPVLIWKFFWHAHRKFLSEDFAGSSIDSTYRSSLFNDLLNTSSLSWYEILVRDPDE